LFLFKNKEFVMPRGRPAGGGVNKSGEIRNYYEKHPDGSTKDCIEFLSDKGIEVSQALVAGVRSRMQGEPGNKKRRRKGEVSVAEMKLVKNFISKSNLEMSVATATLMELASLIDEIGSIERFKDVLNEFGNFEDSDEIEDDAVAVGVSEDEDDDADYEDVNDDDDDE